MRKYVMLLAIVLLSEGCRNHIQTPETLTRQDFERLHHLHLLDTNEQLIQFYSEFKKDVAGNFYTDKRLANYWLDESDTLKNKIAFSFYKDITRIDTVFNAGATYAPYLLITKADSSSFKVYVDGTRSEIAHFFTSAINAWKLQSELHMCFLNSSLILIQGAGC